MNIEEIIKSGDAVFAITIICLTLFLLWAAKVIEHEDHERAKQHTAELDEEQATEDTHRR